MRAITSRWDARGDALRTGVGGVCSRCMTRRGRRAGVGRSRWERVSGSPGRARSTTSRPRSASIRLPAAPRCTWLPVSYGWLGSRRPAWTRVVPSWLGDWCARRQCAERVTDEIGRLATGCTRAARSCGAMASGRVRFPMLGRPSRGAGLVARRAAMARVPDRHGSLMLFRREGELRARRRTFRGSTWTTSVLIRPRPREGRGHCGGPRRVGAPPLRDGRPRGEPGQSRRPRE